MSGTPKEGWYVLLCVLVVSQRRLRGTSVRRQTEPQCRFSKIFRFLLPRSLDFLASFARDSPLKSLSLLFQEFWGFIWEEILTPQPEKIQKSLGVHKILVRKIGLTPLPRKGPKMTKNCTNQ